MGVAGVGFCELNGWQALQSDREMMKNRPKIVFNAANAGFAYSHVMVNSQPYNIGIVSIYPFTVVAEYAPPDFQRGVLHVYFKKLKLHVLVVHLHAHNSLARSDEASKLVAIMDPLLKKNEKVVAMGDFNTLSPLDRAQHEEANFKQFVLDRVQTMQNRLLRSQLHA